MGTGDNFVCTCNYVESENKTYLKIKSYIQNDSIYKISKVTIKMDLYLGDNLVKKDGKVTFDYTVSNGKTEYFTHNTWYDGEVDKVEYVSWSATYNSLWDTYKVWFIASIIVTSIVALVLLITKFVFDYDFDDIVDFVEEHGAILFSLLIVFIPYIINGFSSGDWSWVPIVIILGAIIAVLLFGLIMMAIFKLVGIIITSIAGVRGAGNDSDDEAYKIDDVRDDPEKLKSFSKDELIEWCKDNGVAGYSKLNKNGVISLITNSNGFVDNGNITKKRTNTSDNKKNKSGITFNDIVGLEEAKKAFNEKVIMPYKHKDLFEKFGKKAGGGILLYGLPGTGKTMFAEAASNELDALFIPVKCSDIKSKWYGESEQKVKEIFNKARKAKKAIIFFDEFEAIGAKRTDNSENGNNDLVPQILAEMQGVGSSSTDSMILVIAATNKPWSIDSAFMRPGRFDEKIYIPLPDFEARKKLFEIQLSKLPHEDNLDYELLANLTEGCNGADIKEVCEKLKMSAINDSIATGVEQTIGMDDIEKIKNSIKSSVPHDEIEKLYNFQKS
jgi:transitional endoplasmic reticulum ATPase